MKRRDDAGITQRQVRAAMAGIAELAGRPDVAAEWEPGKERARPVQHEHADQRALFDVLKSRWYRRRISARDSAHTWLEGAKAKGLGSERGWPDVYLHIPWRIDETRPAVAAAVELKAEHERSKVRGSLPYLFNEFPCGKRSSFGLSAEQAYRLQELATIGYQCAVAWGWEEALAFLDQCAGPRPDELPALWVEWAQRSDFDD